MVISSTPAMEASAVSLSNLGALVWIGGNRPRVNAAEIRNALANKFVIDRKYIKVVPHYPEDFFALFTHPHHCDIATASPGRFSHGGLDIHVTKWRPEANADLVEAYYHVHLCIENLSLHAWCDEVATQVLGPDTFLHYFDVATVQREDSSTLSLWAWSANPSAITKVLRLTITGNQPAGYSNGPSATVGRRGLKRRLLVHLDLVEDFTPDINGNIPRRPRSSHPFSITLGVIDGESRTRDRSEVAVRRRDEDQDRDRHNDDRDRGRRGRDERPSSWRDRFFRSRSRAPKPVMMTAGATAGERTEMIDAMVVVVMGAAAVLRPGTRDVSTPSWCSGCRTVQSSRPLVGAAVVDLTTARHDLGVSEVMQARAPKTPVDARLHPRRRRPPVMWCNSATPLVKPLGGVGSPPVLAPVRALWLCARSPPCKPRHHPAPPTWT